MFLLFQLVVSVFSLKESVMLPKNNCALVKIRKNIAEIPKISHRFLISLSKFGSFQTEFFFFWYCSK